MNRNHPDYTPPPMSCYMAVPAYLLHGLPAHETWRAARADADRIVRDEPEIGVVIVQWVSTLEQAGPPNVSRMARKDG